MKSSAAVAALLLWGVAGELTHAAPGVLPIAGRVSIEINTASIDGYLPRAPIGLTLGARNVSERSIEAELWLAPWFGRLTLLWKHQAGDFQAYNFRDIRHGVDENGVPWAIRIAPPRTTRLAPGELIESHIVVGYDELRGEFLFSEPGEYQLKLQYRNGRGGAAELLESNVVHITVTAVPDGERAAFEAYGPDLARFAQYQSADHIRSSQVLAAGDYVEQFPLGPYTRLLGDALRGYLNGKGAHRTEEEQRLYRRLGQRRRWFEN